MSELASALLFSGLSLTLLAVLLTDSLRSYFSPLFDSGAREESSSARWTPLGASGEAAGTFMSPDRYAN